MSGLFGGGSDPINTSSPIIGSLRIQTATRGRPIPLVYGKTRVAPNLIWYSNFTAIPHTTTSGGGGGGGKGGGGSSGPTNTTYTYTAAVVLAICEGAVNAIPRIWADKEVFIGTYEANQSVKVQDEAYTLSGNSGDGVRYTCTVANADKIVGTPYVLIADIGSGFSGRRFLAEGTDYTRSGGVFTFAAGFGGRQVFVSYSYSANRYYVDACSQIGLTMFNGTYYQDYWGWLQTNHAEEALAYRGLSYVAGAAYSLGSDAVLNNHSFEVDTQFAYSESIRDANPKDVLADLLTNPHYGAGFPTHKIADWTLWSTYCISNNIFISPAYTEQDSASSMLQTIMQVTNSGCVYSEGRLKVIPFGDVASTANNVSYLPNLTPVYSLTDDDYLGEDDPVKITRSTNADAYNQVQVKFYNRENQYNEEIVEAKDQANIELFGLRTSATIDLKEVCNTTTARSVAQLILQRSLYIRNVYQFRLGWKYALLEPMDLVTLTDSAIGLENTPVRIVEIEEDKYGELSIQAEEFPLNVCNAARYPTQRADGYNVNYNEAPGNVVSPCLFEGPVDKVGGTGLGVWVAVTGLSTVWGGCNVWVSMDGTTYKRLGKVTEGAKYGTLSSSFSSVATSVDVTLVGKGGVLVGTTDVDAQLFNTLCLVEDELVSYTTTTLRAVNSYTLNSVYRGGYHSYVVSHVSGSRFVRVDDAIVKSEPLDISLLGRTLYFKFTSFNVYGGGEQALADVREYPFVLQGTMLRLPPNDVTDGSFTLEGFGIRLRWSKVSDPDIDFYEVRVGESWNNGRLLEKVKGTSYLWTVQVASTYQVWVCAQDVYGNYSINPLLILCRIVPPRITSLISVFSGQAVRLDWALVKGDFAIDHYEVRSSAETWENAHATAVTMANTFSEMAVWLGRKKYLVAAVDVAGNVGEASSVDVVIERPSQAAITIETIDNNVLLRWQDLKTTLPVVKYEVFKGLLFNTARLSVQGDTCFAAIFENASGLYTYWVVATDSAGNTSIPASCTAQVQQPPDFVIYGDSNVAFEGIRSDFGVDYVNLPVEGRPADWQAVSTSTQTVESGLLVQSSTGNNPSISRNFGAFLNFTGLEYPVLQMRVTRIAGSGWDGTLYYTTTSHGYSNNFRETIPTNIAIGETKILTFDMSSLTFGGDDWMRSKINVVNVDLGTTSADIFAIDWIRLLPYRTSNVYLLDSELYALVTDETYEQHFINNNRTTAKEQVDAGFPLYFEPGATSGWYEQQIDYKVTMSSISFVATLTARTTIGNITILPTISTKLNINDAWTVYNGVSSAFISNFRYVKIRYEFTGTGRNDLLILNNLNIRLSLRQKTDGGNGTAKASDSDGTLVTFNVPFADISSIVVTPGGTAAALAIYNFVDTPNPTSFKVLLYNTNGVRVSGPFSWTAKGV